MGQSGSCCDLTLKAKHTSAFTHVDLRLLCSHWYWACCRLILAGSKVRLARSSATSRDLVRAKRSASLKPASHILVQTAEPTKKGCQSPAAKMDF